ncbi:MAG: hypothetical protein NC082_06610 [Clostridiales bacterium]|nr:hypothetical protein [Clostridiales bacterium]
MTHEQLDILIQRYFDGDTSVAEERALKKELIDSRHCSPLCQEARAVMGYITVASQNNTNKTTGSKRLLRIAASLIFLAATGSIIGYLSSGNHTNRNNENLAWINGVKTDSNQLVNDLVAESLDYLALGIDLTEERTAESLMEVSDIYEELNGDSSMDINN